MTLYPRSLLWRTFLLVAALMILSMAAWFAILRSYEREPRAHQLSQMLVSVTNLTRAALLSARPEARRELLRELSDREGIHIYPAEANDRIAPLPDRPILHRVETLLRERLGAQTRLTLEREGEKALFVSFRIDDSEEGDYWLALPRERIDRFFAAEWLGWAAAVLLLSLIGAWLVASRIRRALKTLAGAAVEIGQGRNPPPLPTDGPVEIATLTRAFNQMSADLARLDQDRALILAGISHDLRTPLTRLRMSIEMSGMEETMGCEAIADIEEMDQTIGQFLDFARTDGGEAAREIDLAALLAELGEQYRRRGHAIVLDTTPVTLAVKPQALRRAIANLIENALRHGGERGPLDITLHAEKAQVTIEVADRGPGIPPDQIERLKLPFTRLQGARTGAVGAGLGLAIVDRIACVHGGRLDLTPRQGGGLAARLVLPATCGKVGLLERTPTGTS